MANVTGIDLNPILQRLNGTSNYHPFDAETFSDWATEAGDMVTISRNGESYSSPIHTSRMVWKGKAPTMQVSTSGNEKRDAVSRVSRKKYGRGSAGIRSNEQIHRNFYSEDGILHSELHITESYLRTEFGDDINGLRGELEMTASHLRTEFDDDIDGLRSEFEVTASHLRTEFEDDVNSLRGEFEVTASHLRTEFEDDVNSLRGEFEATASHLRTEFTDEVHSLRGEFEVTASHLRTEFDDDINSLRGEFEVTASGLRTEFEDDINSLRGEFEVTASGLRTEFEDEVHSVRSYMRQTASSWEARVEGVTDENGNITAASIAVAINAEGSEARIDADRIYLLGQTIANTIDANYIATKIESISSLLAQNITAGDIDASSVKIRPVSGMGAINVATAYNGSSLTQSGNTYTLRLAKMNGEYDEYSFSRATSLSGAWSGRNFTVTASPQGNEFYTDLWSAVPVSNITWNGTVATLSLYATINGGETTYSAGTVTADVGSFLQDKTGANKITANGTYTPDTGYIGFSGVEIDVSGGTPVPTTIGTSWNNGILTITASPQGTTETRVLQQKASTWSGDVATIPIESTYGSTQQYTEGVVYSATIDVSSKLTSARNEASANVTLLDPSADAKTSGIDSSRVFTVSTTGRKNTSGTTENLSKEVPLHLYWDGTFSSNVATVYMKWGSASGSSGTNYAKATVDASTLATNAGYAGRAAVTLNDPTWNPVTGATPTYRTVTVATSGRTNTSGATDNLSKSVALYLTQGSWSSNQLTVFMRAGGTSGTVYASTTVDASTLVSNATTAGKNSAKVTGPTWATNPSQSITGNSNTATFTTDAASPVSGASKSLALYMSQGDWSSNKKYVYVHHTNSTAANRIARYEVDASSIYTNGYKAGWEAYYTKWHYPSTGTAAGMTVYWPAKTVDSAYDSISRTYTIQNKDDNTVYLRYNNQTYAEFAHNKHTAGYNSARMSINTSTKKVTKTSSGSINEYTLALIQDSINTTSGDNYGKRKVWIKATPDSGNAVEVSSATISDYRSGWSAAANMVSVPTTAGTNAYVTVTYPPSTVGGSKSSYSYYVTADNSMAYIRAGSTSGTIVARASHSAYSNGYDAGYSKGVDDYYGDYIAPVFSERYQDNYNGNQYKSSGGTFIRKIHASANTGIHIPLSEDGANAGSTNLMEIPSGGITANGNYKFRSGYAGIRYLSVNVPGSSHSISVSRQWTFAGSGYDTGGKLRGGAFSKSGLSARTYYYITVSCGGTSKQIYFVCND